MQVSALSSLQALILNDNQLQQLPPSLHCLSRLEVLQLQYNMLSALPHHLSALTRLSTLDLDGNPLHTQLLAAASRSAQAACSWLSTTSPSPHLTSEVPNMSQHPQQQSLNLDSEGQRGRGPGGPSAPPGSAGMTNRPDVLVLASPRYGPEEAVRVSPNSGWGDLERDVGDSGDDEGQGEGAGSAGARSCWTARELSKVGGGADADADGWSAPAPLAASGMPALQLQELQDLPPAAAAVLYRSLDSVQSGIQELRGGRPLSRGGSSSSGALGGGAASACRPPWACGPRSPATRPGRTAGTALDPDPAAAAACPAGPARRGTLQPLQPLPDLGRGSRAPVLQPRPASWPCCSRSRRGIGTGQGQAREAGVGAGLMTCPPSPSRSRPACAP